MMWQHSLSSHVQLHFQFIHAGTIKPPTGESHHHHATATATTATAHRHHRHGATATTATNHHLHLMQSSLRHRRTTDGSPASESASSLNSTKLRLICSNGGHIIPRPYDKSLCYIGGETRIVVFDRHTTLQDINNRLSKLLRSSSPATAPSEKIDSFLIKYQLPTEDLDSLISITTDEDVEYMIEEYERLNSSSRIRLFIFPTDPVSVSSIVSVLEQSIKSEDWFVNALNGCNSGVSDTSSVNCLLDLNYEKEDVNQKGIICSDLRGNNSAQDVHSIPDSPLLETSSSFGSASSSPSVAKSPPVNSDDHQKIAGGIKEQFSQMGVQRQHHKHQIDVGLGGSPAPEVVSGSPVSSATAIKEYSDHFSSYLERSKQGLQTNYLNHHHQHHQHHQEKTTVVDLASIDSVLSSDPNDPTDQTTRIQMQQQIQASACLLPMPTTQIDSPRSHLHNQEPRFAPPLQYIHHHPSGAVPVAPYYQHHPHHPPTNHPNFMYYTPTRPLHQGYNFPLQQQQPTSANPLAAATSNPTILSPELPVMVPSSGQNRYQYVGYYATHAMPPLLGAQHQKMTSISPVEASLQEQYVRTAQL